MQKQLSNLSKVSDLCQPPLYSWHRNLFLRINICTQNAHADTRVRHAGAHRRPRTHAEACGRSLTHTRRQTQMHVCPPVRCVHQRPSSVPLPPPAWGRGPSREVSGLDSLPLPSILWGPPLISLDPEDGGPFGEGGADVGRGRQGTQLRAPFPAGPQERLATLPFLFPQLIISGSHWNQPVQAKIIRLQAGTPGRAGGADWQMQSLEQIAEARGLGAGSVRACACLQAHLSTHTHTHTHHYLETVTLLLHSGSQAIIAFPQFIILQFISQNIHQCLLPVRHMGRY